MRPLIEQTARGRVSIASRSYDWIDVVLDGTDSVEWAHPGITVGPDDSIYVPDARGTTVHRIRVGGRAESVSLPVTDAHALSVTADDHLWVADHGHKFVATPAGSYEGELKPGRVIRVTLEGRIDQQLQAPAGSEWRPSGLALHDYGRSSDGRLWVTDGYGQSLLHCFSAQGELLWSSDGAASGLPFSTPHAVIVDTRVEPPVLRIADRGNRRIVTLTLDGDYRSSTTPGLVASPSGFAVDADRLWVTELHGGLVVVDADLMIIDRFGTPLEPGQQSDEWPNEMSDGAVIRPALDATGFRSPHGIARSGQGDIWITEWFIGGRITKLTPV